MAGDQDRPSPRDEVTEEEAEPADAVGIEAVRRLVEDEVRGEPISAAASPSRCVMPVEKAFTRRRASSASPTSSSTSSTRRRGAPAASREISRCRRAVMPGSNPKPSICTPTRDAGSRSAANGSPSIRQSPLVGLSRPTMARRVVDLPAPFGPSRPTIEPRGTAKDRSSTAARCPNLLVRARTSIASWFVFIASPPLLPTGATAVPPHPASKASATRWSFRGRYGPGRSTGVSAPASPRRRSRRPRREQSVPRL